MLQIENWKSNEWGLEDNPLIQFSLSIQSYEFVFFTSNTKFYSSIAA